MWKDQLIYVLIIILACISWHLIVTELYFLIKIDYWIRLVGTILISLFFMIVIAWSLSGFRKKRKIF